MIKIHVLRIHSFGHNEIVNSFCFVFSKTMYLFSGCYVLLANFPHELNGPIHIIRAAENCIIDIWNAHQPDRIDTRWLYLCFVYTVADKWWWKPPRAASRIERKLTIRSRHKIFHDTLCIPKGFQRSSIRATIFLFGNALDSLFYGTKCWNRITVAEVVVAATVTVAVLVATAVTTKTTIRKQLRCWRLQPE